MMRMAAKGVSAARLRRRGKIKGNGEGFPWEKNHHQRYTGRNPHGAGGGKKLVEYVVERNSEQHIVGSIFKGKVKNVVRAFSGVHRYRPRAERVSFPCGKGRRERRPIDAGTGYEGCRGSKGPTVSRELALAGRYVVLMPFSDYIGISRKISDKEERQRLKNHSRCSEARRRRLRHQDACRRTAGRKAVSRY